MSRTYEVVSALNQALTLAFALFLVTGGVAGYLFAKSLPSLLGGGSAGVVLCVASLWKPRSATSRVTVLLTTAFICGFFALRYLKSQKVFPAGFGAAAALSVAVLNLTLLVPKRSQKNKDE